MTTATKRITKKILPAGADYTQRDAEILASRLVGAQIRREKLVAERDAAILAVAQPYSPQIDEIDGELKAGLTILEGWADAHPEAFGKAESTSLSGHKVGWRLGKHATKTIPKWTWAKVLDAIEAAPEAVKDKFLRTKREPNKEAMIEAREDAEGLLAIGVRIIQERRFYLEPAREGQADTTLSTRKA